MTTKLRDVVVPACLITLDAPARLSRVEMPRQGAGGAVVHTATRYEHAGVGDHSGSAVNEKATFTLSHDPNGAACAEIAVGPGSRVTNPGCQTISCWYLSVGIWHG